MKISFIFSTIAILFATIFYVSNGAIIGVDLGSKYFKVALVKPGTPFEIVTNVHTKRKTETLVGFDEGERRFGGDAKTLAGRRPHLVFEQIPHLLGKNVNHPKVLALKKKYIAFEVGTNKVRGSLEFSYKRKNSDEKVTYSVEEIAAMTMIHGRENAEAFAEEKGIKDVVLTVPSFCTQSERQGYLDAAEIAGLKVLSLIEENTAAALQYGLDRIFKEEKTHKMLVYNMGAASTQVSIFEFGHYAAKKAGKNVTFGQFTAIGKGWDETLGGEEWESRLVEFMADEFNKQRGEGKQNIREVPRPMARFRQTALKVKQVLSANQKFPITIQSLHEDKDFKSMITREQFVSMSEDLFDRVLPPVKDALEMANITVDDIDQVEIIGGGVRIPKIQTLLKDFFKVKELGVHLNGDEAIVLGSAFRAANISKAFRVGRVERSVGMVDMIPFPLGVRLKNAPVKAEGDDVKVDAAANEIEAVASDDSTEEKKVWSKRVQLFKIKSHVAKRRLIKFQHDKDILCTLQYDKHSKSKFPEGVNRQLGGYHITGIEKFANGELKHLGKPKVQLSFYLDHNGILKLQKAEATLEEIIAPKEVNETNANKTEDNAEDKKDGEIGDKKETDPPVNGDKKKEESNFSEEKGKDNKTKSTEDSEKNENTTKAPPKPKKKIHRKELNFEYIAPNNEGTVLAMSAGDKKKSMKVLEELQQADDERRARDSLKNTLESYVFSTRSKIREHEEDLEKVSTDEEREKIMEDLEGIEDWLYEDGDEGGANAPIDAYKEKRKKMDERVNALFFRHAELEERPKAVETARIILEAAKHKTTGWITERTQISEDDRSKVIKMIEDIGKWLDEKEKKQENVATTDTPAFTSSDVKTQIRPLQRLMGRMLAKKVPEPVDPNKKNETEAEGAAETDAKDSDATNKGEEKQEEEKQEEGKNDDGSSTGDGDGKKKGESSNDEL
jgi:hypoxia up-regulated 1